MDAIRIRAQRKLQGPIQVSGAKNAALPSLCATLHSDADRIEAGTFLAAVGAEAIEQKLAQVGADIARINIADED